MIPELTHLKGAIKNIRGINISRENAKKWNSFAITPNTTTTSTSTSGSSSSSQISHTDTGGTLASNNFNLSGVPNFAFQYSHSASSDICESHIADSSDIHVVATPSTVSTTFKSKDESQTQSQRPINNESMDKHQHSVVTSPHSGHFMTSNLEDDDDTIDGLGRGLGVEEQEVDGSSLYDDFNFNGTVTVSHNKGYNFADACKIPTETYHFSSADSKDKKLTRDFDSSLSKLFACMSLAYNGKLTTPKFKAFKGLKINIWDKMRLNNIIWREWHLQFIQKHKPLVCSFTINMEDTLKKPQSVVLEGKYWKRKLDIVCVEYQKWRAFYKKVIMPKTHERKKHESGEQISELLDRVADQSAPLIFQNQAHDTMQLDEDLFTALSQSPSQGHKVDYYGFTNSDFIQPNLVGLQPTLDDLTTMDTVEPFQELLAEALGWNSGTPMSSNVFGGSLNNLSESKQGICNLEASLAIPPQQNIYVTSNSNQNVQPIQTLNKPIAPLNSLHDGSLHHRESVTSVMESDPVVTASPPVYMYLDTTASLGDSAVVPTTILDRSPQNHQPNSAWSSTQTILAQMSPSVQQPTTTRAFNEEFVKPKSGTRKPRTIAPKTTLSATRNMSNPGSSSTSSSFLAQLLTNSSLQNAAYLLNNNEKLRPQEQTLVPGLVASSGSDTSQKQSTTNSKRDLSIPNESLSQKLETKQSQAFEESAIADKSFFDRKEPSSAEQKRRCHIKNGFETLQTLVPSLANHPNNKVSKAAMLQKTAEFANKLKTERQQMQEEAKLLQQEIDALNSAISHWSTGYSSTQRPDEYDVKLIHPRENAAELEILCISQLATPLFDSFNTMVSTASIDELYRTSQTWLDQHCTLPALRPAVLNSLRNIGINTSILSDPSKFPTEALEEVNKKLLPTTLSNPTTPVSVNSPESDSAFL